MELIMKIALIASLAAFGFASAALARPGGEDHFDRLDANEDGKVTQNEMSDRQRELFADADANDDGALTKDEMRAHHQKKRASKMGDANGDGVIDRSEYDAKADERFKRMDANNDGKLSDEELRAGHRGGHRGH
jgi:Ca2+-binding EF-hand superfamily protein